MRNTLLAGVLAVILMPNLALASGGFTWISSALHAFHFQLPEHIATLVVISTLLVVLGLFYRLKLSTVQNSVIPDAGFSYRNLVEVFGEFIMGQCKSIIGEKAGIRYFSTIAFLFIFIFLSNVLGLIPGFLPPTDTLNTTVALGLFAFIYYNFHGVREVGLINYIKHFAGPLWYMAFLIFPLEIISNLFRPLSLGLRLYGNMMGDHTVLGTFTHLTESYWIPVPVIFLMLGLLVCFIQAYVFTMITMVYISLATAHQDHGEGHH